MGILLDQLQGLSAKPHTLTPAAEKRRKAIPMPKLIQAILPCLSYKAGVSSSEIGSKLDLTRAGVYHVLHELELQGIAHRGGAGRTTKWFLTKKGK